MCSYALQVVEPMFSVPTFTAIPPSPLSVGIGSVTLVFALTSDVAPKRKYQFPLLRCKLP